MKVCAASRNTLTDLGPSFIKLGQVLASRPDIVREDYMNELCVLQDDVPSFPDVLVRVSLTGAVAFMPCLRYAAMQQVLEHASVNSYCHPVGTPLLARTSSMNLPHRGKKSCAQKCMSSIACPKNFCKVARACSGRPGNSAHTCIAQSHGRAVHQCLQAFAIMEEELGQPLGAVFSSISERPIAAASLGQASSWYMPFCIHILLHE